MSANTTSFGCRNSNNVKIDTAELYRSIARSEIGKKRVQTIARNRFEALRPELLREFDEHPVTQEIKAGAGAANISNTLDGQGDLFSFIGFEENDNPTDAVRAVIESSTDLVIDNSTPTVQGDGLVYQFSVIVPTEAIETASPLPFESGQSWVTGIEKGISGFSQYLAGYFRSSRSGGGIQTSNTVRGGEFKTREYMTEIYRNFAAKFKRK